MPKSLTCLNNNSATLVNSSLFCIAMVLARTLSNQKRQTSVQKNCFFLRRHRFWKKNRGRFCGPATGHSKQDGQNKQAENEIGLIHLHFVRRYRLPCRLTLR